MMAGPLVIVSRQIRRRVDPDFLLTGGLVAWVYSRWGRARAVPMLLFGIAFGVVIIRYVYSS